MSDTTYASIKSTHPVATLMRVRKEQRNMPGQRIDGHTLALAIEGGGMRGVVSGGMVAALEELGLLNCFDVVYGSSAGAISGAYFIAHQARYGVTIFYDNINNNNFIDFRRYFTGRAVMSLEFLLDDVCIYQKPLDVKALLSSPIPLRPIAASISTLKSVVFDELTDAKTLFDALRSSARIPVVAGAPVSFRGDKFLDASVVESIPFRTAQKLGATHIMALLTRPKGLRRQGPSWLDRHVIAPRLRTYHPDLPAAFLRRADKYLEELKEIEDAAKPGAPLPVLPVQIPASAATVRSNEKARTLLVAGAMDGFMAVYDSLGLPAPFLTEVITPVSKISKLSPPR
jgi:predicted patatin/cPLA2 family phospholipase